MNENWKDGLRLQLEDFVDSLVVKGATQADVYDAFIEEIGNLRTAYDRDSGPAEDRPGAEARNHQTNGLALCADNHAITKDRAQPHRPFQHRSRHQCQYIRGQRESSDFGSRARSRGALTSNADEH